MLRYIIKRLLIMIPILLGISFIVLILIDLSPGDVARIVAGPDAEDWEVQEVREELQLEDPLLVRYGRFIWKIFYQQAGCMGGDDVKIPVHSAPGISECNPVCGDRYSSWNCCGD